MSLSKLQAFLLQQQTFLEKCEAWMEFLVQTEEKLAVEISGNYQSLLEQQRAHEVRDRAPELALQYYLYTGVKPIHYHTLRHLTYP